MKSKLILGGIILTLSALFFSFQNFSEKTQAADFKGSDLEIILDASGSMAGQIDGKSKMNIAKEALNSVVSDIPDGSYVAFRAYGHQSPEGEKNCQDTQLLAPFGPINKSDMTAKVNSLQPKGWTPIDYTLRQSENDFPVTTEYKKIIILVSDGEETCGGDPCAAIKELRSSGFDVTVNTVGFDVDAKAEAQLKCIAEASGGEYKSAKNASELVESMKTFSTRAFEGFTTAGGPKAGSGFSNAPLVEAGKYGGDILVGENKFYKLNVKKGQDIISVLNIKRETAASDGFAGTCKTQFKPNIKIFDQYQFAVAQEGPEKYDDGSAIKPDDIKNKSYKVSWKAEKSGDAYIGISNSWGDLAEDAFANKEDCQEIQDNPKFQRALYDVVISIEGEGKEEVVVTTLDDSNETGETVNNDSPEKNSVESSNLMKVILIVVVALIVLGGIGLALFLIFRKRGETKEEISQSFDPVSIPKRVDPDISKSESGQINMEKEKRDVSEKAEDSSLGSVSPAPFPKQDDSNASSRKTEEENLYSADDNSEGKIEFK